jgi:hypothetical protein
VDLQGSPEDSLLGEILGDSGGGNNRPVRVKLPHHIFEIG